MAKSPGLAGNSPANENIVLPASDITEKGVGWRSRWHRLCDALSSRPVYPLRLQSEDMLVRARHVIQHIIGVPGYLGFSSRHLLL